MHVVSDDAEDVPDHANSGLAMLDTGRVGDWHYGRLMEWHEANLIAFLINNLPAIQEALMDAEWIPVSERLPESADDEIQFWRVHGGFSVGRYFPDSNDWQDNLDVDNDAVPEIVSGHLVSHWRPLPKPPGAALDTTGDVK